MQPKGKAHKYGDDVDTDVIIPARYLNTSDLDELGAHCMEDLDPDFIKKVQPGDIIVGGQNFGCGSSREHAPLSIKAAGVSCVIAGSFARIFFRNALNTGLLILESQDAVFGIESGDEIEIDPDQGLIKNLTKGSEYKANPLPPFIQELVRNGGLLNNVKKRLSEKQEVKA